MKKIINGKRYDTDTAIEFVRLPCTAHGGDFGWHDTRLYRTRNGRWFLAGEGNAASRWARPVGNNASGPGHGIQPITEDEAREWLEITDEHEALEKHFTIEDA